MKFKLIDNLKFANVDLNYLKKLYEISSEVYFKESDYKINHILVFYYQVIILSMSYHLPLQKKNISLGKY